MKIKDTQQLKQIVKQPYAFPGGYEAIFITNDGECLCHDCVRKNWREVWHATRRKINDGWRVLSVAFLGNDIEATEESPLYCASCNKQWEAA